MLKVLQIYLVRSVFSITANKQIEIMTAIEKLREIQNEEANNGFANGSLWNDLEDLIYGLENPSSKLETVQSDMYESNIN